MKKSYVLALDAGTTSSRAILFNNDSEIVGVAQKEFTQFYPKPGWVEHDPIEIWETQKSVILEVLAKTHIHPEEIASIGITNQRETTVIWNKLTGKPVYNAIVWQCRRTASICEEIKGTELESIITDHTGLVVDAYFSATKIKWVLDHVDGARKSAERGNLLFGTIDTWLLWNLTNGKTHATDYSNASRTMCFNIKILKWDEKILDDLNIPSSLLPEVRPSSGFFGVADTQLFKGVDVPITGIAGDQQAALFGQTCFKAGMAKNTYGTGCFLMMNTGNKPIASQHGLLTTIAWGIDGKVNYALEGSVFSGGSAVQWLRDGLKLINNADESEEYALQVEDSNGVYVVPAFTGLGAPYWDMYARGAILGLTRGASRAHIVRATLESIAYQSKDLFEAMKEDSGINLTELNVDGGASANQFLMQFQADILGVTVNRPKVLETTALGVAYLAGLHSGVWETKEAISQRWVIDRKFHVEMEEKKRSRLYNNWKKAVQRASAWEEKPET